jgi:hypothetical protein
VLGGGGGGSGPDFSLASSSSSVIFPPGGNATATVIVGGVSGFNGNITVTAVPTVNTIGGVCLANPSIITVSQTSIPKTLITMTASSAGTFSCNITGVSGVEVHSLSIVASATTGTIPLTPSLSLPNLLSFITLPYLFVFAGAAVAVWAILFTKGGKKAIGVVS